MTMKKFLLITLVVSLSIVGLVFNSFGKEKPQYGGILRLIMSSGPQMMSYVPMMGPSDRTVIFPAAEALVDTTTERQTAGGVEPVLAEKVVEDPKNLTITWHIRKGVKFHDGSELDAEVARWNIQQVIDAKALPYVSYLKGMKVVDKYTLVMELNEYSNQLMPTWGWWSAMYSKAAWDKASGGDLKKGQEWARTHVVGTGPFMLKEYKRDVHIIWEKNTNYWRKGRPYLDGIEVRYIPDPVTASAMIQAKEVDAWNQPPAKDQVDLLKKGFTRQSDWPALGYSLWINNANPESKWQDKRLRDAVEYALDKEAITKAIGFGLYRPLKTLPPEGEWGYDPDYNPRPYNPEKARQLVAEAGYPNGLTIKLLAPVFFPGFKDASTAVKQYLDEVGFHVDLDLADPGRFFGTIYWKAAGPDLDLSFWITGRDTNYLQTYMRWFSTEPFTDLSYLGHTPEQAKMDKEAQKLTDIKEQAAMCGKLMRYLMDNALVIPVFDPPAATMQQPWVHSTQYEQGFVRWQMEEIWMEKH
jgi:peptide/nickel transport system substrate-binding protein